ncbi:MAG: type II 3-dehydroquinate dehydratase [Paludibacteraceae bacterium]|nr:type II 3-dehydroquinate dehydratase [Paludibacteraceae bacterium]
MKRILIINGPNLNLLGKREPGVYGNQSFDEYFQVLKKKYPEDGLEYFQSNHEGALIDKIHETGFSYDGIVLNAGAYTHTSVAIADAIRAVTTPVVEVHISNIHKREAFRHHSFLSEACKGCIVGFGLDSYRLAIDSFLNI